MVWVRKVAGDAPLLLPLRTGIGAGEKGGILRPELPDNGTHISKTRAAL